MKIEMAGDDHKVSIGVMDPDDCDGMSSEMSQNHDAGCAAACALVCPGFYSMPDISADQEPAFRFVQYAIPQVDPGLAPPSHLDPPPPRI